MKNTLIYIIIFISLFIMGFSIYKPLLEMNLQLLKNEYSIFVYHKMSSQFFQNLQFAIIFASTTLFYLIVRKITKINTFIDSVISVSIIFLFGIIFLISRILYLKNSFTVNHIFTHTKNSFQIESFNLEISIFLGFLVGTSISILIFKAYKKRV